MISLLINDYHTHFIAKCTLLSDYVDYDIRITSTTVKIIFLQIHMHYYTYVMFNQVIYNNALENFYTKRL